VFWIAVVALTGLLVLLTRVRHRRADAYYA
jgi:hypothetical protein